MRRQPPIRPRRLPWMRASLTFTWKGCFGPNRALAIGSSTQIRDRNQPQPSEPAAGRLVLCRANAEQLHHRSRSWTRTSDVTLEVGEALASECGSLDARLEAHAPCRHESHTRADRWLEHRRFGRRPVVWRDARVLPRQCEQQSAGRLPAAEPGAIRQARALLQSRETRRQFHLRPRCCWDEDHSSQCAADGCIAQGIREPIRATPKSPAALLIP